MTITLASLLSCLISSAALTCLAWALIRNDLALRDAGRTMRLFLMVIIVRMLLPIEVNSHASFLAGDILARVTDFLFYVISVGRYRLTVGGVLLFLWMAGAVCRLFTHIMEYMHFIHIIRKCPGYFKCDVEAVIGRINRECGKSGKFKVLYVPGIQAPAILGIVRPKILIPGADYTEKEIYYILKHEILHYYNYDMAVKLLCEALCMVYWWDPFAFLLRKMMVRTLEIKVDCLLTSGFSEEDKISYMECIVRSMKAGRREKISLLTEFSSQGKDAMMQRFHCIWRNQSVQGAHKGSYSTGGNIMRKAIALKSLLRSPLKTALTFFLIAAASFALFYRVTDYAVTAREADNVKELYYATASLGNEVPDIPMIVAEVESPDKTRGVAYDKMYEIEDKPWLTEEGLEEFASLPGVTFADRRYMTAGRVEGCNRLATHYGGFAVIEGTYKGYEDGESVPKDHILLKFDDVKVIADDGGPKIPSSFTTEPVPLGETYYASSPYTRAFYDSLQAGSRCLLLIENAADGWQGSSGIHFRPANVGEGAMRVIDGEPENYLETEAFALQKGWVDAINYDLTVFDVTYTSDMRAMNYSEKKMAKGRLLTREDTDACVVSETFLEENHLSLGDRISIQFGDRLCQNFAKARKNAENSYSEPDGSRVSGYVGSAELEIVGAYLVGDYMSPNDIYVPSALLPVDIPEGYVPGDMYFSVVVEDANDIEAFYEAASQFAEKANLALCFSDGGWLDVKDSLAMGAFASLLTTVLYVIGAALALFLAVYLYIGRNKKSYAIMRTLGVPGRAAGNSVTLPFVAVSALALPLGGIVGLYYAQRTAKEALLRMADSAPAGYIPDATLPVGVAVLCLVSQLVFISLLTYYYLRKMKKTPPLELLQEGVRTGGKSGLLPGRIEDMPLGAVPAKLDMEKLSAAREWVPQGDYGAVRHVTAYIWRHMRRGIGKTAVSLVLAAVLASGIGSLVLARVAYKDAFYELGVKGDALEFTYSSVMDLSKSPLVKDFYCQSSFKAWVEGSDLDIPMTVTSDLARDLGNDCQVDFAEGYDLSVFEGTGRVCLVGKELAQKLGVSLGDEIGVMSDFLYFLLQSQGGEKQDGAQEGDASEGYKAYKVIGIAQSDEANVKGSIIAGTASDLTGLYSTDFAMDKCEFTLADNERLEELEAVLEEKKIGSYGYSLDPAYYISTGGLEHIERISGLLEALFPIAVAAAVLIGLLGPLLVILQSAQEAAFLRILGVTKKRARCMLVFEQITLCMAGTILVAGVMALYSPGLFAKSIQTLAPCIGMYFMGSVCGAIAAAVQVTRGRLLELLQVKE